MSRESWKVVFIEIADDGGDVFGSSSDRRGDGTEGTWGRGRGVNRGRGEYRGGGEYRVRRGSKEERGGGGEKISKMGKGED